MGTDTLDGPGDDGQDRVFVVLMGTGLAGSSSGSGSRRPAPAVRIDRSAAKGDHRPGAGV